MFLLLTLLVVLFLNCDTIEVLLPDMTRKATLSVVAGFQSHIYDNCQVGFMIRDGYVVA